MRRGFDLADLLTASGNAMATANQRLTRCGAPALLREFSIALDFDAFVCIPLGECTLLLERVSKPNAQMRLVQGNSGPNVRIEATYIAAPSLQTACPVGGGVGHS